MALLEEPIKSAPMIKNYIDGEWLDSRDKLIDVVNRFENETIARVAMSTGEEPDVVVEAV